MLTASFPSWFKLVNCYILEGCVCFILNVFHSHYSWNHSEQRKQVVLYFQHPNILFETVTFFFLLLCCLSVCLYMCLTGHVLVLTLCVIKEAPMLAGG